MGLIEHVHARQIFNSRGNPTVEVDVTLDTGARGRAAIPSGASTGEHEAVELRDGGSRFGGRGVEHAVANVNGEIATAVHGRDGADQHGLDRALIDLDGTPNKRRLGANALLGVSLAVARARAVEAGQPLWRYLSGGAADLLPMPLLNMLNGGAHADNPGDFQEFFMLVPVGATRFSHALRMAVETYQTLKSAVHARGLSTGVGDEGGFAPALMSNEAPLELLVSAIETAGYRPGKDLAITVAPAASEFYRDGSYHLAAEGRTLSSRALVDYWERQLVDRYPVVLLEDGMAENDWDGWRLLTERLGERIAAKIANSVLIKPNRIGTLTETLETMTIARDAGYWLFVSHRSGETEDPLIADFTVATGAGQQTSTAWSTLRWIRVAVGEPDVDES